MSTDPTPADLERARRWQDAPCPHTKRVPLPSGGEFFKRKVGCVECLAALLRSVREQGEEAAILAAPPCNDCEFCDGCKKRVAELREVIARAVKRATP